MLGSIPFDCFLPSPDIGSRPLRRYYMDAFKSLSLNEPLGLRKPLFSVTVSLARISVGAAPPGMVTFER